MCYARRFDVILLVGPTELKVQIGWIDSETVRSQGTPSYLPLFLTFVMRVWIQGTEKRFKIPFPGPSFLRLKFLFRSDAVVVHGDPEEWIT